MKTRSLLAIAFVLSAGFAQAHSLCSDSLLALSDQVKVGRGVRLTGTVARTSDPLSCDLPVLTQIPRVTVAAYIQAFRGAPLRLDTGARGAIRVHSGGRLLVPPGVYHLTSLEVDPGGVIEVDTSLKVAMGRTFPGVEIRLGHGARFSDGAKIWYPGLSDSLAAGRISFYVARDVDFGAGDSIRGQWVVNGSVKIGSRTSLHGRVLAHDIRWGNGSQASFAANGLPLSSALEHELAVLGERRFWTRDSAVEVAWTIDGLRQTSQTTESLPKEGAHWIRRTFGARSDSVLALVDRTPPNVFIVSPIPGSILTGSSVPVGCSVDGALVTDTAQLRSGQNSLTRSFRDSAGNWASARVQLVADLEPPTIRKTMAQNPIRIPFEQNGLRLEWSVSDDLAVVGLDVNGTRLWAQEGKANLEVRPSIGENRYVLTVSDPGGHSARDTVLVVRDQDRIAPRLLPLAGHGSQAITSKDDAFELVWVVTDNDSVVAARINRVPAMFGNGRIESLQRLQPGRNVFVGEATDRAGNAGSDTVVIDWIPDRKPPSIEPRRGVGSRSVPFDSTGVLIAWDVYDHVKLGEVRFNGTLATGGFRRIPMTAPLPEIWTYAFLPPLQVGANSFVLEAWDAERNVSRDTVILTRLPDRIAPRAIPVQGCGSRTVASEQTSVALAWNVSDNDSVASARIDGAAANVASNRVDKYVRLAFGRNEYVIEVVDRTGNIGRDTVVVFRALDTLPPWITLRPGMGARTVPLDSTHVMIAWDVMDEVGVADVAIDGRTVTNKFCKILSGISTCKTWTVPVSVRLDSGANSFVIEAKDSSGNVSRNTVVINRIPDRTPPMLRRVLETADRVVPFDTSVLRLAWEVIDQSAIASATIGGVAVPGWSYIGREVELAVGENRIHVVVEDSEGNIARDVVVITRQPPQMVESAPELPRAPAGGILIPSTD